jgi:NAD(P)-dependent dehydrogenase (short-subunit alcohol dehydrogenase family)
MHMVMTMKYIIPMMIENKQGSIVLMWSDQTFIAKHQSSIYGATKAAIWQLTKSTALDYAQYGIRVNAVCPWTIETPQAIMNARALADISFDGDIQAAKKELSKWQMIERRGTPDEIANVVLFLLSDKSSFMTGSLVNADGGYTSS